MSQLSTYLKVVRQAALAVLAPFLGLGHLQLKRNVFFQEDIIEHSDRSMPGTEYVLNKCLLNEWKNEWIFLSPYSQSIQAFLAVNFLNSVKQWIQYPTGTNKSWTIRCESSPWLSVALRE